MHAKVAALLTAALEQEARLLSRLLKVEAPMVTEEGVPAFAEAAATLATGGSMEKVVRRVRSRVSQNKRRLSRSR